MATVKAKAIEEENKRPTCGIIMPISSIDNCTSEHWNDVLGILKDVCDTNGFDSYLVSEALDVGIIQNRIVDNIYSSDIVICDVSCKNANVMFELGMRLAFDKPTIIIKDDITGYSFDTSVIEHVEYPRDLRFTLINIFKELLGKKLVATYQKSKEGNYSSFLKNFGSYKIAHLNEIPISSEDYIVKAIDELKREVRTIRNISDQSTRFYSINDGKTNVVNKSNSDIAIKWIENEVDEFFSKKINPSAPFDPDTIISDILKSIEGKPNAPIFLPKAIIKKIVRDKVYLF